MIERPIANGSLSNQIELSLFAYLTACTRISCAIGNSDFEVTYDVFRQFSLRWHFQLFVTEGNEQSTAFDVAWRKNFPCVAALRRDRRVEDPLERPFGLHHGTRSNVLRKQEGFSFKEIILVNLHLQRCTNLLLK